MSYRDLLIGLSQDCEQRVLAVYDLFVSGEITAEEAEATIAGIIASHNSRAAALAALSLAATIMLAIRQEVPSVPALPPADEVPRLRKAAATVLTVAEQSDDPRAIVGRLARSEPLETAAGSYSEVMRRSDRVTGWVRAVEPGGCQLCQWWSRDGRVWPSDYPIQTHKGCGCTPLPVVSPR